MEQAVAAINRCASKRHVQLEIIESLRLSELRSLAQWKAEVTARFPSLDLSRVDSENSMQFVLSDLSIRVRIALREDYAAAMSVVRDTILRARILHWIQYVRRGGTDLSGMDIITVIAPEDCRGYDAEAVLDVDFNVDRFAPTVSEMTMFLTALVTDTDPDSTSTPITLGGACLFEDLYLNKHNKPYNNKAMLRRNNMPY